LATQAAWSLGNFTLVAASAVPLTASDATRAAATPSRLTTVPPFGYGVPAAVFPIENTSSRGARIVFWQVMPKAARAPYLGVMTSKEVDARRFYVRCDRGPTRRSAGVIGSTDIADT